MKVDLDKRINDYTKKIKDIMHSYEIHDVEILDNLSVLLATDIMIRPPMNYQPPSNECKELAMLIKFLYACNYSQITINGIVTNPQGKQIKGTGLNVSISSDNHFISDLFYFANTMLELYQGGDYQYEFGWDFKENIIWGKEEHPFFTEVYTNDELDCIIDYENKKESKRVTTKNGRLGFVASHMIKKIEHAKVEFRTIAKLYSFVYDIMLVGGWTGKKCIEADGYDGVIGGAKYREVKNWLNAYESIKNA